MRWSLVFRLAAVALSLAGAGTAVIAAVSENSAETAEMLFPEVDYFESLLERDDRQAHVSAR